MLPKLWQQIRGGGCRAGLTLNPATPFAQLEPYLAQLDLLLIMTVHPGFGGQPFRADQMEKVRRARDWKAKTIPHWISKWTAELTQRQHGCRLKTEPMCLWPAHAIFKSRDYAAEIRALRRSR